MFSEPTHQVTAFDCGDPFRPPAEDSLILTGHFPAVTSADAQLLSGTVEATIREDLHGVTTARADVFLVRDGVLVTVPAAQDSIGVRWDVAAGETESLPGDAVLDSCAPEGLAPGSYEVFARVVLNSDDGATVEFFGGPWPLEVR